MIRVFKKLIYFLVCLALFLELSIYLFPKKELLYYINNKLHSYYISFNSKKIEDKGFKVILSDTSFEYDKLPIAKSKEILLFPLLFVNKITIKNLHLSDVASDILPKKIDFITIYWSLLQGYRVKIYAKGDIGKVEGYVDLYHRRVVLFLKILKGIEAKYPNLLRVMTKEAKGYKYVKNF